MTVVSDSLTDRITIVTGSGHATAVILAEAGAQVIVTDVTDASLDVAKKIGLAGVFFCLKHEIAAKHGVVGLTRTAAVDYARLNTRVHAVLPGVIATPMVNNLMSGLDLTDAFEKMRERHPMGRFGRADEVGKAVKWLLSDDASLVTGAMIPVDGGYLAA